MTLTIDITPELEAQLHDKASQAGLDPKSFVIHTLEEHLNRSDEPNAPHLTADEAKLLQEINEGLPEYLWHRYHQLLTKRQDETLTPEEHAELISLSDQIEAMNVRRLEKLLALAQLREKSLESLMQELGIPASSYA